MLRRLRGFAGDDERSVWCACFAAAAACKSLEGLPGTNWLGSLLGRLSSTT